MDKNLAPEKFQAHCILFYTFQGLPTYSCNKLYEITLKKRFLWEPEKKKKLQKLQISQLEILCMMILPVFFQSCEI